MTILEALTEIRSKPKWYIVDGITDTRLINDAQRIESGLVKDKTISKFLARFGYSLKTTREVFNEKKEKTSL